MAEIVLVRGDEYQLVGHQGTFFFGYPVKVSDDVASHLLTVRDNEGGRVFLRSVDLDDRKISLQLTDHRIDFRCGTIFVQGAQKLTVSASFAGWLMGKKRAGHQVFKQVA